MHLIDILTSLYFQSQILGVQLGCVQSCFFFYLIICFTCLTKHFNLVAEAISQVARGTVANVTWDQAYAAQAKINSSKWKYWNTVRIQEAYALNQVQILRTAPIN